MAQGPFYRRDAHEVEILPRTCKARLNSNNKAAGCACVGCNWALEQRAQSSCFRLPLTRGPWWTRHSGGQDSISRRSLDICMAFVQLAVEWGAIKIWTRRLLALSPLNGLNWKNMFPGILIVYPLLTWPIEPREGGNSWTWSTTKRKNRDEGEISFTDKQYGYGDNNWTKAMSISALFFLVCVCMCLWWRKEKKAWRCKGRNASSLRRIAP